MHNFSFLSNPVKLIISPSPPVSQATLQDEEINTHGVHDERDEEFIDERFDPKN